MWKRSKHEPTESYSYLEKYIAKCMMIHNSHIGPVRTQMTNTQKMNKSEISTKNTHNSHVCSSDEIKSKMINVVKTLFHVCYTDKSK